MKHLLIFLLFFSVTPAFSLETDQFIAANIILKDASEVMNSYFLEHIHSALESSNTNQISCQEVALKVMENATGKFSISKASTFAAASPLIERFPDDSITERAYKNMSFYQHAWIALQVVDLARTININGIYLGTDKFGHFTHMGMNYYKSYLRLKKRGLADNQAIKAAIIKGFGSEYGILGYGIGGVLSYGDLEANYQGFMFALDMCHGTNPIIIKERGQWIENPNHAFDVKNYFTPKMDESFNISFWRKRLYKKVVMKLSDEYCAAYRSSNYQDRLLYYRQISISNLNDQLIQENILTQDKYDRKLEDLKNYCNSI